MTFEIALLLLLMAAALVCFVRELFPIEVTSLGVVAVLLVSGVVDFEQAIAGFSNKVVVTIGSLFVLSHALTKTGLLESFADRLTARFGQRRWLAICLLLAAVALLSGVLNNTAVVAIFIPLVMGVCSRLEVSPSKVLIPLSYATIFGGTMTLIGTSTNLLVSALAEQGGAAPFSMFEFTPLGSVYLVLGLAYVFVFAPRLLPSRAKPGALARKYRLRGYLTEVRVLAGSKLVGRTVREAQLNERYETVVLAILRGDQRITEELRRVPLAAGDTLLVEGVVENLARLRDEQGVGLLTDYKVRDEEIAAGAVMAEGLVAPNSTFIGKSLREVEFRRDYGGFVLAIRRVGATLREKVANIPLHAADSLLMLIRKDRLEELGRSGDVLVLAEHAMALKRQRFWWTIFLILPAVITAAALEIVDIGMAALLGAVLLLLVGALSPQEAYRSIEWSVIFLIAAFIPVGQAMIDTGTAAFLATGILAVGDLFPPELAPPAVLALVYLLTMLLTQMMSNNAAALIVSPLAFSIAASLGVDSRPFLMAVCFAASAEFMTPVGYQTNLMVYGPGSYRFFDYTRFGAPLDLGFWLIGVLLIPRFFPFHPTP